MNPRLKGLRELEKSADRYRRAREHHARLAEVGLAEAAITHAANLAVLARYGEPTINEPLTVAWQRVAKQFDQDSLALSPFARASSEMGSIYLRALVIKDWPGDTEQERLDAIFASMPPWLIWFTHAEVTANVLELSIPDISHVKQFVRDTNFPGDWPVLPRGAFEYRQWPDGSKDEPFTTADRDQLFESLGIWSPDMSKRERMNVIRRLVSGSPTKRTLIWPSIPK